MLAICSLANAGWPILVDLQRTLSHERSKIVNKAGNASRSPRVFFSFRFNILKCIFHRNLWSSFRDLKNIIGITCAIDCLNVSVTI